METASFAKTKTKRIGMIFLVMNLIGIAVAIFLETGVGSDSIGLLCDGISAACGIRFGNASLLYNAAVIFIAFIFSRSNLGLGTIVYALFSGYFIDFYAYLLSPLTLRDSFWGVKAVGFVIGQLCLSLGLAILIQMKLGMNALDAVLYRIEQLVKIKYAVLRTICDCSYVLIGTFLGGTFGPGTICSVLLTGFLVSKIIKVMSGRKAQQP